MMKKIITEKCEEFYIKFGGGITSEVKLHLYIKAVDGGVNYEKVETVKIHNTYRKAVKNLKLSTIKFYTNQAIDNYRTSLDNETDFIKWDGYIGDEGINKKEIMRNQKIKELLDGDTDKLEDFLNND